MFKWLIYLIFLPICYNWCFIHQGQAKTITLGSVLALQGPAKALGRGMRLGLQKALEGEFVGKNRLELLFRNDSYEPRLAKSATELLLLQNPNLFLFVGNVGTPTAKVTLPILAKHNIPAVGFFTGAGLLRPGQGAVINYRASYIQEISKVIDHAIQNNISTNSICSYVQNDAYGMAGLQGVKLALLAHNADAKIIDRINQVIGRSGVKPERNHIGPVGVYPRNSIQWQDGYDSIKHWEETSGYPCRLIVTVGAYANISLFVRGSRSLKRDWIISAVSFTGADSFKKRLSRYKVTDKVIMTQVVPMLNSNLDIVKMARAKLGSAYGFVSLEGFIVGKMLLHMLSHFKTELSVNRFINFVKQSKFNLGGLQIDFTKNGYQGSDLVIPSLLTNSGWQELEASEWEKIL